MHRARNQFLTRPGLAVDQHGRIGGRDRFHFPQYAAQSLALAHDLLEFQLAADFVLEVEFFPHKLVLQLRHFAEGQRVFDGDSYLARDLAEETKIALRKGVLTPATQGEDANDASAS